MISRLILTTALSALLLAACQNSVNDTAENVAETRDAAADDVADARQDASETLADANEQISNAEQDYARSEKDATRKLTKAQSDAMVKTAHAEYDLAATEARGRNDVAKSKCGLLDGVEETACISTADATLAANQADATAIRDAALVNAAHLE